MSLRDYVQHKADCKLWMTLDGGDRMIVPASAGMPEYTCTCGLSALLAQPETPQSKEMAMNDCPRCHSEKVRLIPEIFGGAPKMYCDGCGNLWGWAAFSTVYTMAAHDPQEGIRERLMALRDEITNEIERDDSCIGDPAYVASWRDELNAIIRAADATVKER